MATNRFSSDLRTFFVSDFRNEVIFGIRNIPASLAQSFGYQTLAVLLHVPLDFDISSITLHDISVFGSQDSFDRDFLAPSVPIRMSRNISLDESSRPSVPKRIQRSFSSNSTNIRTNILPANSVNTCRRPGILRDRQSLSISRYSTCKVLPSFQY